MPKSHKTASSIIFVKTFFIFKKQVHFHLFFELLNNCQDFDVFQNLIKSLQWVDDGFPEETGKGFQNLDFPSL